MKRLGQWKCANCQRLVRVEAEDDTFTCPECGATVSILPAPIRWKRARHLGGHPALGGEARYGTLVLTNSVIGLEAMGVFPDLMLELTSVASIEVTGGQVARSRVGPIAVFGVLGLGAKGRKDQTGVIVRMKDGESAYFLVDRCAPLATRAQMTSLLRRSGIPFFDEAPMNGPDLSDQLRKLADLKADGLLTDEEFKAQKAKLLDM